MIKILSLFTKEQLAKFKEKFDGCLVGPCPSCGNSSSGSNSSGCIINPKTNTLYCFGSKTIFNGDEAAALVTGVITCREGRQRIR